MDSLFNDTQVSIEQETTTLYYSNNTSQDEDFSLYAIFVPLIWGIMLLVGACGNGLVIYTLIRHGDKNVTNYFVINLAVTDLTFVVSVLPVTASLYVLPYWMFGNVICKLTQYLIYVTLHATCLTLMAMTIDRYCAIVYAVQSRTWRTNKVAKITCIVVWLVSFLIPMPYAFAYRTVETDYVGHEYCAPVWPEPEHIYKKVSIIVVVITTYVIPLTIISICYVKILATIWRKQTLDVTFGSDNRMNEQTRQQKTRRKHVTKLVAVVVIMFALCWLPIHIVNLLINLDVDFPKTPTLYFLKTVFHTLSYANSCINPFLYAFVGDGFCKAFRKAFPSMVHRCKRNPNEE